MSQSVKWSNKLLCDSILKQSKVHSGWLYSHKTVYLLSSRQTFKQKSKFGNFGWFTYIQLKCLSSTSTRKINSRKNGKTTLNLRPSLESFRRGESKSAWSIYFCVIHFWPLIFWNTWKQGPNKNSQSRIGFASSNTRLPRSQILLRCFGSYRN